MHSNCPLPAGRYHLNFLGRTGIKHLLKSQPRVVLVASLATAQHATVCTTRPHIHYKRIIFRLLNRIVGWIHYRYITEPCLQFLPFLNLSFHHFLFLTPVLPYILLLLTILYVLLIFHLAIRLHFIVFAFEGCISCSFFFLLSFRGKHT